jgi:hypothetical protein
MRTTPDEPRRSLNAQSLRKQPLTIAQILAWVDDHHERRGKYPNADCGPVLCEPAENWAAIDQALMVGIRGLPGKDSLARLLMRERGRRHRRYPPRLTEDIVFAWAQAHHDHTGSWPNKHDGAIEGISQENWANIDQALRRGLRGLSGGDSLSLLLRRRLFQTPLTVEKILVWADAHRAAAGRWPGIASSLVSLPEGETWKNIDRALRQGERGLPGGSSLGELLVQRKGQHRAGA